MRPRQFRRVREHAIEVDRNGCQSLGFEIILQLTFNRAPLISRNGAASDEQFEGVGHFKPVEGL